jgi:hypothetical protein
MSSPKRKKRRVIVDSDSEGTDDINEGAVKNHANDEEVDYELLEEEAVRFAEEEAERRKVAQAASLKTTLTQEQRDLIEKNRLAALERRNKRLHEEENAPSLPPAPITNEDTASAEAIAATAPIAASSSILGYTCANCGSSPGNSI